MKRIYNPYTYSKFINIDQYGWFKFKKLLKLELKMWMTLYWRKWVMEKNFILFFDKK